MTAPINPALIIGGPAVIVGRGVTIWSRDNIVVEPRLTTFAVESSALGELETREDAVSIGIRFAPVGALADFAAYYPYASRRVGELAHLTRTMGTIDTTDDEITITAHGFRDGHGARVASFGTLPAGLVAATKYYVHRVDADTISLHLTEAAAIAGTSAVDITDAGTGTHRVIEEEPITIWSINEGRGYTFHNHIVEEQPELTLAGNAPAFGSIGLQCFRRHAVAATDAAAIWTAITSAPTYAALDPDDIVTQPYTAAWGAVAPWASFGTREGFRATFPVGMEDVPDDVAGVLTRRITSRGAEVRARPRGVTEADVRAKMLLQGTGAGRGRSITGDNLNISATGLYLRLYAASLSAGPENYDRAEDRIGELVWRANQHVTGGVADPLFYLGTVSPTG